MDVKNTTASPLLMLKKVACIEKSFEVVAISGCTSTDLLLEINFNVPIPKKMPVNHKGHDSTIVLITIPLNF